MMHTMRCLGVLALTLLLASCGTSRSGFDYSAFRASKPASILVLPPVNASLEPDAAAAVLAQSTRPLAESGYYVTPVAVVYETFLQNGFSVAEDVHALPVGRLRDIFGADAALYMTVQDYGARYTVLSSTVTVSLTATLVDLRTGTELWRGEHSLHQKSGDGGNLLGQLVRAAVAQVVHTLDDSSYDLAGQVSQQLLGAGRPDGLLYGPRSPHGLPPNRDSASGASEL